MLPFSVRARTTDGLLDWNAHELFMLNVAAVQALAARVDALERPEGRDPMTADQKLCYSEGTLWRNRVKGQCIGYAGEVVRADPYSYIPEDQTRSLQYHNNRVRVVAAVPRPAGHVRAAERRRPRPDRGRSGAGR